MLYANACSRMDLDIVAFIDENGFEKHSLWDRENPEISKRYDKHAGKVKRFDCDEELKFRSDV